MISKDYTTQELDIAPLNPTPDLYRSMDGNPFRTKFGSNYDPRLNTFRIREFVQGYDSSGAFAIFYTNIYKTAPLVQGIKKMRDGSISILVQQDENVLIFADRIQISINLLDSQKDIVYIKARVVSLDDVTDFDYTRN